MEKAKLLLALVALTTAAGIYMTTYGNSVNLSSISDQEIPLQIHNQFKDFLLKFKKAYAPDEYSFRLGLFYKSVLRVEEQNKKESPWKAGINKFSDMTPEEIKIFSSTHYPVDTTTKRYEAVKVRNLKDNPEEKNWVDEGAVTSVKDQSSCQAGYAFGAIEPYESMHFLKYNQLLSFSTQQVVDCSGSFGNRKCSVSSDLN